MLQIHLLADAVAASAVAKSGNPYHFTDLQGVMAFEDGRQEVFVYRLFPKRGEAAKSFKAGRYVPTIDIKVDFQTRKLVAEMSDLRPVAAAGKAA